MVLSVEEKMVLVLGLLPQHHKNQRTSNTLVAMYVPALLASTGSTARRHRTDGCPGQCPAPLVVHSFVGDLERHVAASIVPGHRGLLEVLLVALQEEGVSLLPRPVGEEC